MERGLLLTLVILILGIAVKSNSLIVASGFIILIKLIKLQNFLPLLEEKGVDIGLIFLTLAILAPLAMDKISLEDLGLTFRSLPGILALCGGIIATRLNGMGLNLLKSEPQVIIGLLVGSIIGIVALKGIPVGPLMPGGVAALLLYLIKLFSK